MNLLAFDTGTEAMSIAVGCQRNGGAGLWQHSAAGGARSSTDLIPVILDLLRQAGLAVADLHAICFGAGPGSFTGLRTACSVAQGLGFGGNVPLLPVDSLLAVAEEARYCSLGNSSHCTITALLDARMGEVYLATYQYGAFGDCGAGRWQTQEPAQLMAPQDIAACAWTVAGNVAPASVHATPTATAMLRLAPQLLAQGLAVPAERAWPTYIRDKVAQTTAERAAEKAARAA